MQLIRRGGLSVDSYRKFIRKMSYNFSARACSCVWDYSQFESEGTLVFYECLDNYDNNHSSKSRFFTFFYRCLVNRYLDILSDCRKSKLWIITEEDYINLYDEKQEVREETGDMEYKMFGGFRVKDYVESCLGKRMFQQANALDSLNRTLKLLPASALDTFKAIMNFEGMFGAKETRARRLRGQRVCYNIKSKDLKEVMLPEKSKSQLSVDLKNIRFVLKGGELFNPFPV